MGLFTFLVAAVAAATSAAPPPAAPAGAPPVEVPLDPHYAPLFVVGNAWAYSLSEHPEGNKKQRTWRETCTVAQVVAGIHNKQPVTKATVTCLREASDSGQGSSSATSPGKGTGKPPAKGKLSAVYVASAKGLRKPGWWETDESFPRVLPLLLANPPQTSAFAHDVLEDDKDWAKVTKVRFKGPRGSAYSQNNLYVELNHPDTATLPDKRPVPAWTVSWSYNSGSGGAMLATLAPGVGLVRAHRAGGGDDFLYSSWTAELLEFRPVAR